MGIGIHGNFGDDYKIASKGDTNQAGKAAIAAKDEIDAVFDFGKDGIDGIEGKDAKDGIEGKDGKDGIEGKDMMA